MPQRKITAGVDATALPDLTAKQMAFVEHIIAGKTASDAYRAAYTDRMAPQSIWGAASRLRNDPKIVAWLDAAKIAGLCKAGVTYETIVRELDEAKVIAKNSGNIGAMVECIKAKAKYSGLDIERHQEVPIDPVQTLREMAAKPEGVAYAKALAAEYEIDWDTVAPDANRTVN